MHTAVRTRRGFAVDLDRTQVHEALNAAGARGLGQTPAHLDIDGVKTRTVGTTRTVVGERGEMRDRVTIP